MRGTFFVIEGIDGAGKSTVSLELTQALSRDYGVPALHTYEPYPSGITETLYAVLYGELEEPAPPIMATLFAAARWQHVTTVIEPALADGLSVVCDRYIFSSLAYNTSTGVTRADVERLHDAFYLAPDHVFYLRCDPDFAATRLAQRTGRQTIYEQSFARLARAEQMYSTLFQGTTVNVCGQSSALCVVDAMQPLADVMQTVAAYVATLALPSPLLQEDYERDVQNA